MKATEKESRSKVYYVRGSGYFPVPEARIHEIPSLRRETHETELKTQLATSWLQRRA